MHSVWRSSGTCIQRRRIQDSQYDFSLSEVEADEADFDTIQPTKDTASTLYRSSSMESRGIKRVS